MKMQQIVLRTVCKLFGFFPPRIACVASVSNRVIARKLEREQKVQGFLFFCSRPDVLDELRAETLALQATPRSPDSAWGTGLSVVNRISLAVK